jgi:hypothetical protein
MQMADITKQQGVPCSVLLLYLLLIRILEVSVFRFYKEKWYGLLDEGIGKNCFYRFLANASYNWRGLLLGVASSSCASWRGAVGRVPARRTFISWTTPRWRRLAVISRVSVACMTIPVDGMCSVTRC